jgi:hypothetical protein
MLILLLLGSAGLLAMLWLVVTWLSAGGRLPLRRRRGTASGLAGAGLALETFYRPGARQAFELRLNQEMRREDDNEGDGPETGTTSGSDFK